MKVTVDIPDRVGWVLANHAEARSMKVGELIAGMVLKAFRPSPAGAKLTLGQRVVAEWEQGVPDPVIARRLGVAVDTVRRLRRAAGLKPHRFQRERWDHELGSGTIPALHVSNKEKK